MGISLSSFAYTFGSSFSVTVSGKANSSNRITFSVHAGGSVVTGCTAQTDGTTTTIPIGGYTTTAYTQIEGNSLTNSIRVYATEWAFPDFDTVVSITDRYGNTSMQTTHRSTVSSWTSTYTIGNTITVNITKTYSGFRSAVAYYINGTLIKRVSGITGTSTTYTPNETEIAAMKTAMGGLATGTISINLETGYVIDTGTWYWGYRSYSGTASQTLESILTNGLQNFTVNSGGVTYTITRYNSSYVHRVELIHWNGTSEVIIMTKNGQTTSCAFSLVEMTSGATSNIYLRNTTGNTVRIRVRLTTFESNGTTQVGTAINYTGDGTTTGVATFDTTLIRPTFTSYAVTNTLSGITGNVLHWVQNKSTGVVTVTGAAGSNSSTITNYTAVIGGVTATTGVGDTTIDITVKNLTGSQAISVYVTDSRGNQSLSQATPGPLTFYAYSAPSVTTMLAYREAFNDDTPLLNVVYQISVVGTNNPQIQWRKTQLPGGTPTTYTDITDPTPSGGVYTVTASTVLGVCTASAAFLIEFQIRDSITTSYSSPYSTSLPQGTPIMHMENGKVGINTTTPAEALDVSGNIQTSGFFKSTVVTGTSPLSVVSTTVVTNLNADKVDGFDALTILQRVFPVGSLYTTNDGSTNPSNASLLGFGTWSLVAQGTYPMSAGASYGAGTTGGSLDHSHVLSDTGQAKLHHSGGAIHGREITTGSWERNLFITVAGSTGTGAQTTGIGLIGATDSMAGSTTFRPPYIAVYIWRRTA